MVVDDEDLWGDRIEYLYLTSLSLSLFLWYVLFAYSSASTASFLWIDLSPSLRHGVGEQTWDACIMIAPRHTKQTIADQGRTEQ